MHIKLPFAFLLPIFASFGLAASEEQAAGHHVIFSYPGLNPPTSLFAAISQGKVAGIIFFAENIGTNITAVINQFNSYNAQSPTNLPLLFMTDQEGGQVRRLSGAPEMSAKQVGASSNPAQSAASAGTGAGQNLVASEMNLNLAPVLDVYREAGNFIDQYQRSFSNNATVVGTCGSNFVTAQQNTGVAATAKHFPGLGSAPKGANTDVQPVTLNLSLSEIRSVDEAPYTSSIKAGIKLVMPSWAVYPAGDTKPSGLSSFWIQQELRGRLGFTGVTISDAIEAGALSAYGNDGNRAVLATQAGMDIILASARDVSQGLSVVTALTTALQNGQIDTAAFGASTQRITDLRKSLQ